MHGSIFDGIIIICSALVISVLVILSTMLTNQVFDAIDNTTYPINDTIRANTNTALGLWDMGFIFVIVFSFIASGILASQINSTPAFFIITIIIFTLLVFLAPIISNIFYEFATTTGIVTYANNFPLMIYFFQNIAQIVTVLGVIIIIATHGKVWGVQQ